TYRPKTGVHNIVRPTYILLGVKMTILLSGDQTGNEYCMIEAVVPPGCDVGLHLHPNYDEAVTLLSGELETTIGDSLFTLHAGQSIFVPRTVPHRFRNLTNEEATGILVNNPGPFDKLVRAAGVPVTGRGMPDLPEYTSEYLTRIATLAEKYGFIA